MDECVTNVFCWQLCGLAMAAIGAWMLIDQDLDVLTGVWDNASNSHLLRVAAILLIAVGALLFIISLLGIIGAVIEHKVVLGIVRKDNRAFYSAPVAVAEYCDERVCLCVCSGAYLRNYKLHVRFSPNFLYMLPMARPFFGIVAIRCVSGCIDNIIFVHNRPYGGMSISLQRVKSLRHRAQLTPLLRRIDCVES